MRRTPLCALVASVAWASASVSHAIDLPDAAITEAYEKAATQNVFAAVNPEIFPGYWSVCADGIGFGVGNTYPALDGHQMADALAWLGRLDVLKANWNYVRSFQRPNGQLPFAILPAAAGQEIGPEGFRAPVDANGGLYKHWVPSDPLRALGYPTYIQNADVIFRFTQDLAWLRENLPSINLAADFLASLTTPEGAVAGAGYYIERPTRVEYDGVTQCHAVDAFRRIAKLNAIAGDTASAEKYGALADRVEKHFQTRFWAGDRFVEYIHPERGAIATHGYTDVDWSALALGLATPEQAQVVWPVIRDEKAFRYGGMPTGIATQPDRYESWEFSFDDRMDLAAMGRVWYLECQARRRMGDAQGLVDAILPVCRAGRDHGYYWRERYGKDGGFGVEKYNEYPANLVRIVQRFLLGIEFDLDGSLTLAPLAPPEFWAAGFGQTLQWRGRTLEYRMDARGIRGAYRGDGPQQMRLRFTENVEPTSTVATIAGKSAETAIDDGFVLVTLPASTPEAPVAFDIRIHKS